MCTWVQMHRSQRCRIPLELELQVVLSHLVWVLGIKLRSRGRAVHASNFGAISLASYLLFLKKCPTYRPVEQIKKQMPLNHLLKIPTCSVFTIFALFSSNRT